MSHCHVVLIPRKPETDPVSIPETSSDPKPPGPFIVYSKQAAAQTQLETAIALWFNYGDPMSILTLAAATICLG